MKLFSKILIAGIIFVGGILYGIIIFQFKLFPYEWIHSIYFEAKTFLYIEDTSRYEKENLQKLIQINTMEDVIKTRKDLIDMLWGGGI